jgi:hypothetical protein
VEPDEKRRTDLLRPDRDLFLKIARVEERKQEISVMEQKLMGLNAVMP